MPDSTTHLIQVRTKHMEDPECVAADIRERLSDFIVEAVPAQPVEAVLDRTLGDTGAMPVTIHIHAHGCEAR